MFCFQNSCHTRQPLLETLMLPQRRLYARISNRNSVESCRLVSCFFITMHPHTYKSRTLRATIRKCGFVELNHPPYSPDLAPSDYFLFIYLKKFLHGRRSPENNAVKEGVTGYFDTQDIFFLREFDLWRRSGLMSYNQGGLQ